MSRSRTRKSKAAVLLSLCTAACLALGGCSSAKPQEAPASKAADSAGAPADAAGSPQEASSPASDTAYPEKPIQLIVPYGAGGDTDTNARVLSKYLSEELGQAVVVSNVTGASGVVGTQQVLEAAPDGYTVLFNHPTMLMNSLLGLTDISYKDFENAGIACLDDANVFVVNADSPYETLDDIIEDAKNRPGKLRFATSIGSFTHLQILAFQQKTGTEIASADLGDMAAYVTALLGDQIEIIGCQYGVVKDYIESGKFRCVGVLSEERNPLIPDVPTFKEQGVDLALSKFFFFAFPKGTPENIVNTFSAALEKVCQKEEYMKEANEVLVTPTYMAPEDALAYIEENETFYKENLEKVNP